MSSNILEFFKALPVCAKQQGITFSTPTEICMKLKSVDNLYVPDTLSWMDEERDVSTWLGNPMQREAFNKLYSIADRVRIANDPRINQDWDYLQASDNFRFMSTKPSRVGMDRGIYDSPFDAFTNYMNILGDFLNRVNTLYPADIDNEELNSLLTTIRNQGDEIEMRTNDISNLQAKVEKLELEGDKLRALLEKKAPAKKAATPKATAKKPVKKAPAKKAPAKKAVVAINAENVGFKAGDVYNALAAEAKALTVAEIAKAAKISSEEAYLGIGWLFKEGKVKGENDKVTLA